MAEYPIGSSVGCNQFTVSGQEICKTLVQLYEGQNVPQCNAKLTALESNIQECLEAAVWILNQSDVSLRQQILTFHPPQATDALDFWALRLAAVKLMSLYVRNSPSPVNQELLLLMISLMTSSAQLKLPADQPSHLSLATFSLLGELFMEAALLNPNVGEAMVCQYLNSIDPTNIVMLYLSLQVLSSAPRILERLERENPSRIFAELPDSQWRGWRWSKAAERWLNICRSSGMRHAVTCVQLINEQLPALSKSLFLGKMLESLFCFLNTTETSNLKFTIELFLSLTCLMKSLRERSLVTELVTKSEFWECVMEVTTHAEEYFKASGTATPDGGIIDSSMSRAYSTFMELIIALCMDMVPLWQTCLKEEMSSMAAADLSQVIEAFTSEQMSGRTNPLQTNYGRQFVSESLIAMNSFVTGLLLGDPGFNCCSTSLGSNSEADRQRKKLMFDILCMFVKMSFICSSESYCLMSVIWQSLYESLRDYSHARTVCDNAVVHRSTNINADSDISISGKGSGSGVAAQHPGTLLAAALTHEVGLSFLAASVFHANKLRVHVKYWNSAYHDQSDTLINSLDQAIGNLTEMDLEDANREYYNLLPIVDDSVYAFARLGQFISKDDFQNGVFGLLVDLLERSSAAASAQPSSLEIATTCIHLLTTLTEPHLYLDDDDQHAPDEESMTVASSPIFADPTFSNMYFRLLSLTANIPKVTPSVVTASLHLVTHSALSPAQHSTPLVNFFFKIVFRCAAVNPDAASRCLLNVFSGIGAEFRNLGPFETWSTADEYILVVQKLVGSPTISYCARASFIASTAAPISLDVSDAARTQQRIQRVLSDSITTITSTNDQLIEESYLLETVFPNYLILNRFIHYYIDYSRISSSSTQCFSVLLCSGGLFDSLIKTNYKLIRATSLLALQVGGQTPRRERIPKISHYHNRLMDVSTGTDAASPYAKSLVNFILAVLFNIRELFMFVMNTEEDNPNSYQLRDTANKLGVCLLECLKEDRNKELIIEGKLSIISSILTNSTNSEDFIPLFLEELAADYRTVLLSLMSICEYYCSTYNVASEDFAAGVLPTWQILGVLVSKIDVMIPAEEASSHVLPRLCRISNDCLKCSDTTVTITVLEALKTMSKKFPRGQIIPVLRSVTFTVFGYFPIWHSRTYITVARFVDAVSYIDSELPRFIDEVCVDLWSVNSKSTGVLSPSSELRFILSETERALIIRCAVIFRGMRLRQLLFDLASAVRDKKTDVLRVYEFVLSESPSAQPIDVS